MHDPPYDWARLQLVKVQDRSVSQATEYLPELGGCSYKYFLNRVVRAWDRPAAWLPQGLAVHEAAEWWERSGRKGSLEDMREVYKVSYREHTERLLIDAPNTDMWSASGRYEGPKDILRRAEIGLAMVDRYHNYYVNQKPDEIIWITPDGTPAIELGFSEMFGTVRVRGYIDQILTEIMRDIKSGNKPGGMFQLSVYRYAILKKYGVDFASGDYWMGKTGKPTNRYDLTQMTEQQVIDIFEKMDAGVKAEEFAPSPDEDKCRFCSVSAACKYSM